MTREQLNALMETTGVYFDPDHPDHVERSKIADLPPPFMEFYVQEVPFGADDIVYYTYLRITIRLYSDVDEDEAEVRVREALDGRFFRTKKEYNEDFGLWETTFTFSDKKE